MNEPSAVKAVQLKQVTERPKTLAWLVEESFDTVSKLVKFAKVVSSGPQLVQITVIKLMNVVMVSSYVPPETLQQAYRKEENLVLLVAHAMIFRGKGVIQGSDVACAKVKRRATHSKWKVTIEKNESSSLFFFSSS